MTAAAMRRRGAAATRNAILSAARTRFLGETYETVGLRDIAREAGVDAALIVRHFGSKAKLFDAVIGATGGETLFAGLERIDDLPDRLSALANTTDSMPHAMETLVIMLRSASSPRVAEAIRERLRSDVLEPLAVRTGEGRGGMRAYLVTAILTGAVVLQSILRVEAPGSSDTDRARSVGRYRALFRGALNL